MDITGESVPDLLDAARRAGFDDVTSRQVERWHKAKLLPRRRQHHESGLRGSRGRYPVGTERWFLRLCQLRRERRKLHELAFRLWWDGYAVLPEAVRRSLRRLVGSETRRPSTGPKKRRSRFAEAEAAAMEILKQAPMTSSPLGKFRRRIGSDEDFYTAVLALLLAVLGGEPSWERDGQEEEHGEAAPQDLVFDGLGLKRAATDRIGEADPWLADGADAIPGAVLELQRSGLLRMGALGQLLDDLGHEELDEARQDARIFLEDIPVLAAAAEDVAGRGALGLSLFKSLPRSARDDARMVLMCVALRRACGAEPFARLRAEVTPVAASIRTAVMMKKGSSQISQ